MSFHPYDPNNDHKYHLTIILTYITNKYKRSSYLVPSLNTYINRALESKLSINRFIYKRQC